MGGREGEGMGERGDRKEGDRKEVEMGEKEMFALEELFRLVQLLDSYERCPTHL